MLTDIRKVDHFSMNVYEAVRNLVPQLNPEMPVPSQGDFRAFLESDSTDFFVAVTGDGEIAGMLTLACYRIPTCTRFWIEDVVVDERFRGHGIGKALVRHSIEYSAGKGAKSVDLTSRPFRIAANKMYRDMGFELRETNVYRYHVVKK